jgi:CheY-like chemotaxis protein
MATAMSKRRILLVDDEPAFTRLLKLALERAGYEVRVENSGSQALAVARAFQPHLVLLDVIMPDLEGSRVAEQMRMEPALAHVPSVFLTAIVSRKELPADGAVVGGFPFIAKPATASQVIECLERHLPPVAAASVGGD